MRVTTRNNELKFYAANKGVRLWQVAEKFGITDATFSRKLRKEFSKKDADKFKKYVDEIADES
jgi:predicted DNA binding protein